MRYIRTKDGIERVNYGEDYKEGKSYFYKTDQVYAGYGDVYKKTKVKTYAKNGITKIADTIEELCDLCVVIHKYREQPQDMSFYAAKFFIDVYTRRVKSADPIIAIFGAIWTDKGLIYIAKMNEKGELELL